MVGECMFVALMEVIIYSVSGCFWVTALKAA